MVGERGTINLEFLLGNSEKTLVAAAHELKAPLGLIKMYASCLGQENLSEEKRKKYTSRLLFTSEQMIKLTIGLIEGKRWVNGQLPLEPVNTKLACEEVFHELYPAAKELEHTLEFRPGAKPGIAIAHREILKNLVFNLVFNSLKHTPAGSSVIIGTAKKPNFTSISVLDSGPGFNKKTIEYVNRGASGKFQAAPERTGSGLGLAVAQQLTHVLNGRLTLKKLKNGGYCYLSLPVSRQMNLPL
jgi:signal transduction histidine kinase